MLQNNSEKGETKSRLPLYKRNEFLPILIFTGFIFFLLISTVFSGPPPHIKRIFQEDNLSNQILTIEGTNFGNNSTTGKIKIGDITLSSDNYLTWENEKIILSVPREVPSGLIYVITKSGRCLGDIYINPDELPRLTYYAGPLIKSIEPGTASPGRIITIKGERFGQERMSSFVQFLSIASEDDDSQAKGKTEKFILASEFEYEYVFWSDTEVKVRVPDGAKTGMISITTNKGQSNARYLSIMRSCGRKEYSDKVGYQLNYNIILSSAVQKSEMPLLIYLPLPLSGLDQRRLQLPQTYPEELLLIHPNLICLKCKFPERTFAKNLTFQINIERYALRTEIEPSLVEDYGDKEEEFYKKFTSEDMLIKPLQPALSELYLNLGKEKNPYLLAKKIYNLVISLLKPTQEDVAFVSEINWTKILREQTANSYLYANLFVSLARGLGIPARLVSGWYLENSHSFKKHSWAEFYLNGFGWVPVDPFLEDKIKEEKHFNVQLDCFGKLNNKYIALSNRWIELPKAYLVNQEKYSESLPSFQSFHIESPVDLGFCSINFSIDVKEIK